MFNLSNCHGSDSLSGKFIIANPYAGLNEIFSKALIYLASHNSNGAVGLIVNHPVNRSSHKSLFKTLQENTNIPMISDFPVYIGGPVEPQRGFVLHTSEYNKNPLIKFDDQLSISSNVEILKDIAHGNGPKKSLLFMGYTGWDSGQLEKEIGENFWIISERNVDLIFSDTNDTKWEMALKDAGIIYSSFCSQAGHD